MDQNTRHTQGQASLNVWSGCQSHGQRQNRTEHKGHAPSSKIEVEIPILLGMDPSSLGWKAGTLPTTPW